MTNLTCLPYLVILVWFQFMMYPMLEAKNPAIFSITDYYKANPEDPEKVVALTFDDGPHTKLTPKLLDILKEKNAKATFFVMGVKVASRIDVIKRAIKEGHEIGNHVFDHPVISKISYDELDSQMQRSHDAIYNQTKYRTSVMRPPYGNTNKRLNNHIMSNENLSVVMWSYDTNDWKRPGHGVLVTRITTNVKAGDVILCHDIHPGTIQAVPYIIDAMQAKGYTFETVSTMMQLENSIITNKKKATTTTSSSSSSSSRRSLRGSA